MSDAPVRTWVLSGEQWTSFQEFMIRGRAEGPVDGMELRGIEAAVPPPEVLEAIASARAIVIGPSNPVISINPILEVPGMRDALAAGPAKVVAVSPLVEGAGRQGPDRGVHGLGRVRADRRRDRRVLRRGARRHGHRRTRRGWPARPGHGHADGRRGRAAARRRGDPAVRRVTGREHVRDPPRQALRARQAAPRRHAQRRLALGAGRGDGHRRPRRAAPRQGRRPRAHGHVARRVRNRWRSGGART